MSSIDNYPNLAYYKCPVPGDVPKHNAQDNRHNTTNALDKAAGDGAEVLTPVRDMNNLENPTDLNAGDEAEYFDPQTQTWQPTINDGPGRYKDFGAPYREAVDFNPTPLRSWLV